MNTNQIPDYIKEAAEKKYPIDLRDLPRSGEEYNVDQQMKTNDKHVLQREAFISGAISPASARYHQDFRGCPCEYLDEPCMPRCTCKMGTSSAGCMYCATYGSIEQRKEAAIRIAGWIKAGIESKRYHQEPVAGSLKTAKEVLKSDDDFTESISEIEEALIIERMELYADQFRQSPVERFQRPTDEQIVKAAIVFNDGKMDKKELMNMVALCDWVIDRLYENGNILIPSSKE